MSHEDFARYVSEGATIAGHEVAITTHQAGHVLWLDQSKRVPLAFHLNEGFESRMEKVVAALEELLQSEPVAA
jgi:hypothetical protein